MSEITNEGRSQSFDRVLQLFERQSRFHMPGDLDSEPEVVVSDLLTNCMHWCAQRQIDFSEVVSSAREAFLEEVSQEEYSNPDCYIEPAEATRIRIFEHDEDGWCIDAGQPDGQKFTEKIWTHYNEKPLSKDKAIEVVAEFAAEIGRPDLLSEVYIDQTGCCCWEKLEIGKGDGSEVSS